MPQLTLNFVKKHKKKGTTALLTQTFDSKTTIHELKQWWAKNRKTDYFRQSFKVETSDPKNPTRLEDKAKTLEAYGLTGTVEVVFRDIGPQVGYRTVFLVEYAGPIFMMALCMIRPALIYGAEHAGSALSPTAHTAALAFILHFVKRELETVFVHKFSRPTMPLANIFKNSIYYWSFAFFVSYILCHPAYTPTSDTTLTAGLVAMAVFELINFLVHVQFATMRPKEGSLKRDPPAGPLFALVSCPNYTAEVMSWVAFSIATNVFMSYAFTLVGFLQMTDWALKKHRNYIKSYKEYKSFGRKAIVPFLI